MLKVLKLIVHNFIIILFLTSSFAYPTTKETADMVFKNGTILTINSKDTIASDIAIKKNKILAVGTQSVKKHIDPKKTKIIDLNGATLMPGFIGAHEHPGIDLFYNAGVNLSGFKYQKNKDVWNALETALAAHKDPKKWFFGVGLDVILTPDLELPTKQKLDELTPDGTPVILVSQTLHSAWVNSAAFKLSNIIDGPGGTADPVPGQSYYQRDKDGKLTGYVVELSALKPIFAQLINNQFSDKLEMFERYSDIVRDFQHRGYTSVGSLGINIPPLLAKLTTIKDLIIDMEPPIRQIEYLIEPEIKKSNGEEYTPQRIYPFFRMQGVKFWYDGSPYTGQMYTSEKYPYLSSDLGGKLGIVPGSHGHPAMTPKTLAEKIDLYTQKGWQISIHTQGDESSKNVFQALSMLKSKPRLPVRLEHLLILPTDTPLAKTVRKLKSRGVKITTSFHINHIFYYGDALVDSILGPSAMAKSLMVKTAFDLGLRPTLHDDSPMFPPDPFILMRTAITRKTMSGKYTLNKSEKITIQQAIRAMTINAAYQLGIENKAGSLEPGKWADFIILDKNPYKVDPNDLPNIQIKQIYLAGKLFHSAS